MRFDLNGQLEYTRLTFKEDTQIGLEAIAVLPLFQLKYVDMIIEESPRIKDRDKDGFRCMEAKRHEDVKNSIVTLRND